MHICFNALDYPSSVSGGGVGNQVRLLAHALIKEGHRVSVIALTERGLPDYSEDGAVKVYRVHRTNLHWYVSKVPLLGRLLVLPIREIECSWATYKQIRAIHEKDPIDVVEGTETGMFLLPLMPQLPSIIRLHGEPYSFHKYTPDLPLTAELRLTRLLQRSALRRVRLLVSPSAVHAKEVRGELGKSCPPLEVVPNAISDDLLTVSKTTEDSLDQPAEEIFREIAGPIILFVGRLERRKGVPLLLQAAARVLAENPDAHFVLAGARHSSLAEKDLEELLQQLPDRKRVHLIGHLPWERLLRWYRKAALCVLPSYYETFGLAALEPMAIGIPLIALKAGALPEVVEDGVSGLLVPPGDADALAREITRVLANPELGRCLAVGARRRATEHFRVSQHIGTNLSLLAWAAKGHQAGPSEHIFLSPHLDDAVLSCGGLIHEAVSRGEKVRVVTAFASVGERPAFSAFARHLHAKWGLVGSISDRLDEDRAAFRRLGVQEVEHWEYLEAPYRRDASGEPLYCTYEGLKGKVASLAPSVIEELIKRIRQSVTNPSAACRLYFPLGLGEHVDHRLLFQVGLGLRAEAWDVRFYEDWPYAEAYEPSSEALGWLSEIVAISVPAKHEATLEYRSQLRGLGGSPEVLRTRMAQYANKVGGERYWYVTPSRAASLLEAGERSQQAPFIAKPVSTTQRGLRRILRVLRGIELKELLPPGGGLCLDLDGTPANRSAIEAQGYRWLETSERTRGAASSDCLAAVVAWRPMDKVSAEMHIRESFTRLEPGGVVVGKVELDDSHTAESDASSLRELLHSYGFLDVQVRPVGIPERAIITRVRRFGKMGRYLAAGLTMGWLCVGIGARALRGWLGNFRAGQPEGAEGRTNRTSPLRPDHLAFVARKPAPRVRCTLAS